MLLIKQLPAVKGTRSFFDDRIFVTTVVVILLTVLTPGVRGQTSKSAPSRQELEAEIARLRGELEQCRRTGKPSALEAKAYAGLVSFRDGSVRDFVAFYGVRWKGGARYEQLPTELLMRRFDDGRDLLVPLKGIRRISFRSGEKYRTDGTGGTVVFAEVEKEDGTKQSLDPAELLIINIQFTNSPIVEKYYGTQLNGMVVTFK